jgi:GNAT superfamily N-acetyltransferase
MVAHRKAHSNCHEPDQSRQTGEFRRYRLGMTDTSTQIDCALRAEAMLWDYDTDFMPPGLEVIERDELLMWRRASGPASEQRWANRVSFVRSSPSGVDRVIDEALSFFGPLPFTWVVGPSSRPPDIAARLRERGLADVGDGDLLTAVLPILGLRTAADVAIVEVEGEAIARVGLRLAHPDAPAPELEALLEERLSYLRHPQRRGGFLVAFVGDEPAGSAGYRYSSDGITVYLNGADTAARFRGRGIYQALVAHRAAAALAHGCRFAAIRARRDTSLPILMKRGFVDHGHLPIFARQDASVA